MSARLVRGASEICLPALDGPGLERLPGRALVIRDGRVTWIGPEAAVPASELPDDHEVVDAEGGAVLPALVDCHTHLVWAGDRVADFALRSEGVSYAEIAARGGGILTTVRATRATDDDALLAGLLARLEARRGTGVGATEVKTGYGLTERDELRTLEVVARARALGWDLEATLLAAHAVPFDQPRELWLDAICERLIPEVADRGLARFVDVFVERGAYTVTEARRVFEAARAHGLLPRVHADQLTPGGGAELAAEQGAASADHLEHVSAEGLAALREAGVVATLLPGAGVFLGDEVRGLGRRCVAAGVEVAVATDHNPGSSPLPSLPLAATLATTQMGLTADQALRAVTLGAARALRRPDLGDLRPGCRGRFLVLEHADPRALVYAYGAPAFRRIETDDPRESPPRV